MACPPKTCFVFARCRAIISHRALQSGLWVQRNAHPQGLSDSKAGGADKPYLLHPKKPNSFHRTWLALQRLVFARCTAIIQAIARPNQAHGCRETATHKDPVTQRPVEQRSHLHTGENGWPILPFFGFSSAFLGFYVCISSYEHRFAGVNRSFVMLRHNHIREKPARQQFSQLP
ncbi:unnamed protein product [Ectocarpus fasciculatus]